MAKRTIVIDPAVKETMRQETELLRSTLIFEWNGREERIGQIAQCAGICESTLRNFLWSRTRNPSLVTFVGIATALGLKVALIRGNRKLPKRRGRVEVRRSPRGRPQRGETP